MNIREMMQSVPGSYDDFVDTIVRWTNKDEKIKSAIIEYMKNNPDSSSSDILGVLWDCLDFDKPLDIVEDEAEYRQVV